MRAKLKFWIVLVAANGIALVGAADPTVEVVRLSETAHPNEPYEVALEVTWSGPPDAYTILPAEFGDVDWGSVELTHVESFRRDDTNVVVQRIQFVANTTGEFDTPDIRIAFFDPEAVPEPKSSAQGTAPPDQSANPTLHVPPFSLSVQPDRTPTWIAVGLGASLFLAAAIAGWIVYRRKTYSSAPPAPSPAFDPATVREGLHAARKHRLDGDVYGFYTVLSSAAQALPESSGVDLRTRLTDKAQHVGYGGERPSDDEMDGDFRDLERALAAVGAPAAANKGD